MGLHKLGKRVTGRETPSIALAYLLEQTARAIHSQGYAGDLFPAQWSALRYFSRSESNHRTASALANYQGLASGPVTRTVRTLISKGLLAKAGSLGRGRAERIDLTEAGRKVLATDPLSEVAEAISELSETERRGFAAGLEAVLLCLQQARVAPASAPQTEPAALDDA